MRPTCRWVFHSDYSKPETMYCGKLVHFHMEADDDGRQIRTYDNFCEEHFRKINETSLMRTIKITAEGAKHAPSWETFQLFLRALLDEDPASNLGRITRIRRQDGGCDYRAAGLYDVLFVNKSEVAKFEPEEMLVKLEVK